MPGKLGAQGAKGCEMVNCTLSELPGVTGPTLAPKSPACGMALPDLEIRALTITEYT